MTEMNSSERIRTWDELQQGLKDTFIPIENDEELRGKLREIKQTGTIAEYNKTFQHIMLQISDLSFSELKYEYLRGLNSKIRDLVQTKDNIMDICKLQQICFRLDTQRGNPKCSRD